MGNKVKTTLFGLVFAFLLAGCETVEDMRDMRDTQEQVKGIIKEEFGIESMVGFNMNNGVLIDVSIVLSAGEVGDRTVSELARIARSAIRKSFESRPRAIYLQIATTIDQ